jgi:hypothetical protein
MTKKSQRQLENDQFNSYIRYFQSVWVFKNYSKLIQLPAFYPRYPGIFREKFNSYIYFKKGLSI